MTTPRGWRGSASAPIASASWATRASTAWCSGSRAIDRDDPLLRLGARRAHDGGGLHLAGRRGRAARRIRPVARPPPGRAPDPGSARAHRGAPRGGGGSRARRRPAGSGAPERGHGARAAPPGGSGRRAGDPLRRGDDGLRRRRVRAGRDCIRCWSPRRGAFPSPSGLAGGKAGTRRCCSRREPRRRSRAVDRPAARSCTGSGGAGSRTKERRATQGERARNVVERGRGASRRSAEMLGASYFVTTPSNVTDRGTMSPSVSPVISTSLHRLRTLIRRSATPLPPAS